MNQKVLRQDWIKVKLASIAEIKYGKANPKDGGQYPVIGSGGEFDKSLKALIKYPTIIIGRKGTAGVVWLSEKPCWPSDTTFYLEWKTDEIDYNYIFYYFLFCPLSGEHAKTTLPSIKSSYLKDYLIFLPPLSEQRAIARALRAVQSAIDARRREIELERERKAALMEHLFTYGTRGEPTKQTEIGEMPESWDVVKLKDFANKPEYGYTTSAIELPIGPKFLRITDIQNENVNWETVPYCKCNNENQKKYLLKTNDLIIARIGATTGKVYLIDICPDAVFASYLLRVKTKKDLLPEFLYFYCQTENYWKQILASKGGKLKGGINIPILQNLVLPLPSMKEQKEIIKLLNICDKKNNSLENESSFISELFNSMLEELMTGNISSVPLIETQAKS